jgi:hypothetical protein
MKRKDGKEAKRWDDVGEIWEYSGEAWRREKYGNLGIWKIGDM